MAKKVIKVKCINSVGPCVAGKRYDVFLDKSHFIVGRANGKPFALINNGTVFEQVDEKKYFGS